MKKAVLTLSIVAALMCVGWSAAFAADNAKPSAQPAAAASAKPATPAPAKEISVTFTGVNEPRKMKVAGKDVTENELKIASAKDDSGKVLREWNGRIIRYTDNDKGKELIQGHANEQVTVKGMLNPLSHMLTVTSFEKVEAKAPASPAPSGK
jgi:hypothetical protein